MLRTRPNAIRKVIDGVKIKCIGTSVTTWETHPLLDFHAKLSISTGEVYARYVRAQYKGLLFEILQRKKTDQPNLFIRGSLARYYNDGKTNAFDFTVTMLAEAVKEIETTFSVNLNKAVIQKMEFGANLQITTQPAKIINGLRAWQSDTFTGLKAENTIIGKQLIKQNTIFKIYDKAKQAKTAKENILRMEYVFRYTKKAKIHGINVLADLLNRAKLEALKPIICEVWEKAIYFDNSYKRQTLQRMTDKERKKFLLYLDGSAWKDFNRSQRQKARLTWISLLQSHCPATTQTDILTLLKEKLNQLTEKSMKNEDNLGAGNTTQKGYALQKFSEPKKPIGAEAKKIRFTALYEVVNRIQNNKEKTPKNPKTPLHQKAPKNPKKAPLNTHKFCVTCDTDITKKKAGAMYCCKYCNNSAKAHRQKQKRHETAQRETASLLTLNLKRLHKNNVPVLVTYRDQKQTYTDFLEIQEINPVPGWTKKVIKIEIKPEPASPKIFTSYRAKQIVKSITNLNNKGK